MSMPCNYKEQRELFQSPALSYLAFKGVYNRAILHELRVLTSSANAGRFLNFSGLRPLTIKEKAYFSTPESPGNYGLGLSLSEHLDPLKQQMSRLAKESFQRDYSGVETSIMSLFNCLQFMNPEANSLLISVPAPEGKPIGTGLFLRLRRPVSSNAPDVLTCFDAMAGDTHSFDTLSMALAEIWNHRNDK